MNFDKAFAYKRWANAELLDFGGRQLAALPAEEAEFFVRILNHTTVVDSLFISRIKGEEEKYDADNTVETPSIDELKQRMDEHDSWLVSYAENISEAELARTISFEFVDGDKGRLQVSEILLHLLTHGSNHRGMASRVLSSHKLDRPRDTFTRYLHQAEPERRG